MILSLILSECFASGNLMRRQVKGDVRTGQNKSLRPWQWEINRICLLPRTWNQLAVIPN
uniref:Uncharacterized protein n=1 Tax=Arundo donax TaxID=35708 RepID=A0A0A9EH93_ARUDO